MIKAKKNQDKKAKKECSIALKNLKFRIPKKEYKKIIAQYDCDYDKGFWGNMNIYKFLSKIIPKNFIIIDFGCYFAPQSYYFKKHTKYIGVDTISLNRFQPKNAVHYVGLITNYILENKYLIEQNNDNIFAICSYVLDQGAMEFVRRNFSNVFCFYPSKK